MLISLMRHGQTDWNLRGLMQGRTDIPLNETGRQQAHTIAELMGERGETWDAIVSSTLSRAHETSAIVAEVLGIPFVGTRLSLIEQHFGEAEGAHVDEIARRWPDRKFPSGEANAAVGLRGFNALNEIAAEFPSSRVLAVTHGAFIRRVLAEVSGEPYDHFPRIHNVSLSTLRREHPGWRVLTVSDQPFECPPSTT